MSLKPTHKNHLAVGISYSAKDWANHAIGGDKIAGPEGFENFSVGGWNHWWHYKNIDKRFPERFRDGVLDEMSQMRENLVNDIMKIAELLDERVTRLEKMELQIKGAIEESKGEL